MTAPRAVRRSSSRCRRRSPRTVPRSADRTRWEEGPGPPLPVVDRAPPGVRAARRVAASSGADAVLLDLEDAVPEGNKARARAAAVAWPAQSPGLVRVNAVGSPWHADDLAALAEATALRGVVLPKSSTAPQVAAVIERLPHGMPVLALVRTRSACARPRRSPVFRGWDGCCSAGRPAAREAFTRAERVTTRSGGPDGWCGQGATATVPRYAWTDRWSICRSCDEPGACCPWPVRAGDRLVSAQVGRVRMADRGTGGPPSRRYRTHVRNLVYGGEAGEVRVD
ncbi:aldolase/citrate lyase family protein [Streptomyces scopuliridis]|uniref:aldolase/citrate lyase family protein n=1 Tax=Streptomyces scopuliridis TaxID=452529 RepID=UPI0036C25D22